MDMSGVSWSQRGAGKKDSQSVKVGRKKSLFVPEIGKVSRVEAWDVTATEFGSCGVYLALISSFFPFFHILRAFIGGGALQVNMCRRSSTGQATVEKSSSLSHFLCT